MDIYNDLLNKTNIYTKQLPKSCYKCAVSYIEDDGNKLHQKCPLLKHFSILGKNMDVSEYVNSRPENCPLKDLTGYYKQVCKEMLDNLSINLGSTFTKEAEFTIEEIIDWLQNIKERINNEK